MAIDMDSIKTFAELKKLDDAGLIAYALHNGVTLNPEPRKDLLGKCASIFLSKKSSSTPELPLAPSQPAAEEAKAIAPPPEPVPAKKKAKAKKGEQTEEKSQKEMDLAESFTAACKSGQDFPRCPYCGSAITVDTGVRDGNLMPVCGECTDKVNKSKEKVMKATAKANKAVAKKAKKTISTKTGRKGNTDALKKAREAAPKDDGGFRLGSGASELFQALKKGITLDKAKAIKGNATAYFAAFQMKVGAKSEARAAVIKHDEKTDKYTLKSFTNAEGKTVHVK